MFEFLNKPYPFNDDLKSNAKIIFFLSLGNLAYLLIFEPVELASLYSVNLFYIIAGIVGPTFIILTLNLIVIPSLFPKIFNNRKWDIKREILWDTWILLSLSSIIFFVFSNILGIHNITYSDIVKTIFFEILPVAILITINQARLLRYHLKTAQELNKRLIEKKKNRDKLIFFHSQNKKDELAIKPSSLRVIKSSDNYIEIYYKRNNKIIKTMLRSTLKNTEILLSDYKNIFRCHRSYIVNIDHIVEILGNSQGYKIFLDSIDFPVLVSHKYIPEFQKLI